MAHHAPYAHLTITGPSFSPAWKTEPPAAILKYYPLWQDFAANLNSCKTPQKVRDLMQIKIAEYALRYTHCIEADIALEGHIADLSGQIQNATGIVQNMKNLSVDSSVGTKCLASISAWVKQIDALHNIRQIQLDNVKQALDVANGYLKSITDTTTLADAQTAAKGIYFLGGGTDGLDIGWYADAYYGVEESTQGLIDSCSELITKILADEQAKLGNSSYLATHQAEVNQAAADQKSSEVKATIQAAIIKSLTDHALSSAIPTFLTNVIQDQIDAGVELVINNGIVPIDANDNMLVVLKKHRDNLFYKIANDYFKKPDGVTKDDSVVIATFGDGFTSDDVMNAVKPVIKQIVTFNPVLTKITNIVIPPLKVDPITAAMTGVSNTDNKISALDEQKNVLQAAQDDAISKLKDASLADQKAATDTINQKQAAIDTLTKQLFDLQKIKDGTAALVTAVQPAALVTAVQPAALVTAVQPAAFPEAFPEATPMRLTVGQWNAQNPGNPIIGRDPNSFLLPSDIGPTVMPGDIGPVGPTTVFSSPVDDNTKKYLIGGAALAVILILAIRK